MPRVEGKWGHRNIRNGSEITQIMLRKNWRPDLLILAGFKPGFETWTGWIYRFAIDAGLIHKIL